jgi:hypothetical protein
MFLVIRIGENNDFFSLHNNSAMLSLLSQTKDQRIIKTKLCTKFGFEKYF